MNNRQKEIDKIILATFRRVGKAGNIAPEEILEAIKGWEKVKTKEDNET